MNPSDILQQLSVDFSKLIKNNLSDIKKLPPNQQKEIGKLMSMFKDGLDDLTENTQK